MNLLPKSHQDFGQKDYWNSFFQKRGAKSFEWYGEYAELCGYLHKYIKPKDDILVVGCGNSKLSMDLYDVGCRNITNIDISQLVINQMNEINKTTRADMKYIHMDATCMSFDDEKFSVVLDKGTLDALMTDDSMEVAEIVKKYFTEITRVLRTGGRFVCISLLQEHILRALVKYFPDANFMFRIVRCIEAEEKTAETSQDGTAMPVFMIIATKFAKLPFAVLEIGLSGDQLKRLKSPDDLIESILSIQKAALVCNGLHRSSIADCDEISLDLCRPDEDTPRFTVYILDQKSVRGNGKFAIFIVPQGRETEWLFSTPQGRRKLLASAQHDRLAIVTMHRGQVYTTWDNVKMELSENVKMLSPIGVKDAQIPFLSLGSDVGKREIIFKGKSQLSGDYIVEEICDQSGKTLRRLIFLNNQFVIQSEALIKIVKVKNEKKKVIDRNYLACQHHLYMTLGVNLMVQQQKNTKPKPINIAVIGLGGGGLCTFMRQCLKNIKITAVDIDETMLTIATNYFDLKVDENLHVLIDDGIEFLQKSAEKNDNYEAILFDVDSKDSSLGMSCPPQQFLNSSVLDNVKKCIGSNGIFILNLVCRDEMLRNETVTNLKQIFKSICSYKLDEDVNEILYCHNGDAIIDGNQWLKQMENSSKTFNKLGNELKISNDDLIEVQEFLKQLIV